MGKSPVDTLFLVAFVVVFSPSMSHAWSPAVFIFGDSLVEVGTNSLRPNTIIRANFPYNGIDFFNSTPSGRFCNGQNVPDFLAKIAFGPYVTSPPTFLSLFNPLLKSEESLTKVIDFEQKASWETPLTDFNYVPMGTRENPAKGVNFASAGTGVTDAVSFIETGVPMFEQLAQLTFIHGNLSATMGSWKTQLLFAKSTFFICNGNNDVFWYIFSLGKVDREEFVEKVIENYSKTLKVLYNLGARKFGIIGIPYVGCVPLMRVSTVLGNCSKIANDLALQINGELERLLFRMKIQSRGMVYSFADTYALGYDLVEYPARFRFTNSIDACCGNGRFNAMVMCNPVASLCDNRDEYFFWDLAHPTQRGAQIMVETFAFSGRKFTRPINFATLVRW